MDRKLIRAMSLHGRLQYLRLLILQWKDNNLISNDLFVHQFERLMRITPQCEFENEVNPISGKEMLRRIKKNKHAV